MGRHKITRVCNSLIVVGVVSYCLVFGLLFSKLVKMKLSSAAAQMSNSGLNKAKHNESLILDCSKTDDTKEILNFNTLKSLRPIWQNVSFCDQIFVFSSFSYFHDMATITGAAARTLLVVKNQRYFCRFYDQEPNTWLTCTETIAQYKPMPESRGKRYSAAFFTCPLPKSSRPYAVSLSTNKCQNPSNILPIVYPKELQRDFTVCVTPLNYQYSKAYELVEMIELNRILGANHFVFYNYSTDYNVDKVLEYYKKLGIVDVLKWNLPMKVDTWPKRRDQPVEIHYFAQLAALNDCLYRNMYVSKFVVFEDLDEFIIPQKHENWSKMMSSLPEGMGAYIFRCVFFRKEWPDVDTEFSGKDTALKYKMSTLLKQNREPKFLGKTHRSKYIVDPKQIDTVGIHNVWKLRAGARSHFVNPEFARMHHYRNWENPNDAKTGVLDDRILMYKDRLLQNTVKVWESLRNVPLGPLNQSSSKQ